MSRIGITPITVPPSVAVNITDRQVVVKGEKGELTVSIPRYISLDLDGQDLKVKRSRQDNQTKALHGLTRSLLNNTVIGVSQGYVKKLELLGTGYRAKMQARDLVMSLGFSHPITYTPPEGITLSTEGDTVVVVTGVDKQAVGQVAANIRAFRPPEPYKGKGVRYQGEVIRRKAGKAAKAGSA